MNAVATADIIPIVVELFWRKGYAQTSMAEIVEATGLNRYSLYSTLGNKREIFLTALDAYFDEGREKYEPMMRDPSVKPLERIRMCLQSFADSVEEKENGCFICHVAPEHHGDDPQIMAAINSYFEKILELIEVTMAEAEADGSLNPNLTPRMAAQIAFDAKMSMGVFAKVSADRETFLRIADNTISALSAPPATK